MDTGLIGNEVEITHLVKSAQWTIGQRLTNRIGGVMQSTRGSIILDNVDGQFSVLNTTDAYVPLPGSRIRILQGSNTLFTGWTSGVLMNTNTTGEDIATMPIYSSLQRLQEYGEGLFAQLSGIKTTDRIFREVMQAAEENYPLNIRGISGIQVYTSRLNRTGALGSGRRLASFNDALNCWL